MSTRIERRLVERLATLTLRKAVGLIVTTATLLAVTAAVLERLIDPAFDTLPEALWFAVTTVSTVGYGDVVPESGAGRIVAATLMLTGLALIPMITSVVVSILASQRTREAREEELQSPDADPRAARQARKQVPGVSGLPLAATSTQPRAMQRKPMCEVEVSTVSPCRAAGR